MDYKPCDQFAADMLDVQREVERETGVSVYFDPTWVELMVDEVEEVYAKDTTQDFNEILEMVLWKQDFSHDIEYTAHKRVLGKIFGRRSAYRQQQDRQRGKYAPFAEY